MLSVVTYNSGPWQAFTVINMEANYCPLKAKFGINIPIQALELRYLNKYQYTPAHIYIPTVLTSSEAKNISCFTYPCSDTVTQIWCLQSFWNFPQSKYTEGEWNPQSTEKVEFKQQQIFPEYNIQYNNISISVYDQIRSDSEPSLLLSSLYSSREWVLCINAGYKKANMVSFLNFYMFSVPSEVTQICQKSSQELTHAKNVCRLTSPMQIHPITRWWI